MFPSSKVSAFLSHLLEECANNNSKDPLGAIKSARKALRHLRACQASIPDDGTEFPSQPYIAGVTSKAKTATCTKVSNMVRGGQSKNDNAQIDNLFRLTSPDWDSDKESEELRTTIFNNEWQNSGLQFTTTEQYKVALRKWLK